MTHKTRLPHYDIFRHLANCFLVPDESINETVSSLKNIIEQTLPSVEAEINKLKETLENISDLKQLQIDYTRIFIGPYTMLAPPYESVYRKGEGQLMGNSSIAVLELYKKAGLDLSEDYHDAPDHVSTELEFVYLLLGKIEAFKQLEETDNEILYKNLLKSLLEDHLFHWMPEFTYRLKEKASCDFYSALAHLTEKMIMNELNSSSVMSG
ncbi:MAG: molecular chaperone TorD family protein [Desulfamplus sp.]|nr:molecular chaperone TorD family protein [Desulfamplus sp.]